MSPEWDRGGGNAILIIRSMAFLKPYWTLLVGCDTPTGAGTYGVCSVDTPEWGEGSASRHVPLQTYQEVKTRSALLRTLAPLFYVTPRCRCNMLIGSS